MALELEQRQLLSKARLLGPGTALPVVLKDSELLKIVSVIFADLGRLDLVPEGIIPPSGRSDYYDYPLEWFNNDADGAAFEAIYEGALNQVEDFQTYFKCLTELHKRRRKYEMILQAQPLPTSVQISPRALLEFGILSSPALASWMTWRKWFYDIDNRSAQETGYLFEPILANALGGTPYGARNSPVRRSKDARKGRQVDCVVDTDAYEFKLRVTIAASGQGRFGEEIEFVQDCVGSGLRPILLVLDPTTNHRLDDLSKAFRNVGGEAYIGSDAWEHIEQRSGQTMAIFVEKYVRRPISTLDTHMSELLDLRISASPDYRNFEVTVGQHAWKIDRHENQSLATDDEGDAEG